MIKIKLGGFPFKFPQRWEEVKPKQAKALFETKPEEVHKRLSILTNLPIKEKIKLDASVLIAVYEVVSFIEEIPELVSDKIGGVDIANDWSFVEFENARQAIIQHKNELGLCLYRIAEIKGQEKNYLEYGVKALDAINTFLDSWGVFDIEEDEEPTALEEAAGIERVQMFGVYSMLEAIAAKFAKLPTEIEKEPVGWVYQQYHYDKEVDRFRTNYQKLTTKS